MHVEMMPSPKSDHNVPQVVRRLTSVIHAFEITVVVILIFLMMIAVALSTVELGMILWQELMSEPFLLLGLQELLTVLGFFMMVLIGLELLETIKNYLTQNSLHVEIVLLVAMIAVARKVIIIDMKEMQANQMLGIAALLLSLAGSYFLIKRSFSMPDQPVEAKEPKEPKEPGA